MPTPAYAKEVTQFARSSAFRNGDHTAFSVNLAEGVMLSGNCSPAAYLDMLYLDTLPEHVMVMCAGNGGLAVECFNRGAKHVVAVEPRSRFKQGILGVMRLLEEKWRLEEEDPGANTITWHPHWPTEGREGLQNFDLILWPEGVEEITRPKEMFQAVRDCLAPDGKLMVEITLGSHDWVERINSWRPTGHAVEEMAVDVFEDKPVDRVAGRSATTRVYTLVLERKKATPKPLKVQETPEIDNEPTSAAKAPLEIVSEATPSA